MMTRTLRLAALTFLAAAAGCVSDRPDPLDPFELAPAQPGRAVWSAGHVSSLSTATSGVAYLGTGTGSQKQLQVDLPTALAVAGARSVEVRYAQAKTDEVRQGIYSAVGSLFPSVVPGIVARAHRDALQKSTGEFIEVTKQQELAGAAVVAQWQPGQVIFRALAATRRTDAAELATETARANTALAVAEGYYDLVRVRALVRIADEALETAREIEHIADAKEKRGAGIKVDTLRARADVSRREVIRTNAEADVAIASARLAALLQLEPDVELVPLEDAPLSIVLVSNEVPLDDLLAKAETARPEIREADALISAAEHDHEGVKWGPLVPQADAGMVTGRLGPTLGQTTETNDFAIGVGWKIGPGGLFDLPAINAAAARVRQARLRDEGLHVDIARQVVTARARALAADRAVASARDGVVAAEEALRLSKQRFEKGAGIVLEVLDAQRALTQARTSEVQAIVDLDTAQYRLLRAIGEPIDAARPR